MEYLGSRHSIRYQESRCESALQTHEEREGSIASHISLVACESQAPLLAPVFPLERNLRAIDSFGRRIISITTGNLRVHAVNIIPKWNYIDISIL